MVSKSKMVAIALGALALFVGGLAVASAATPASGPVTTSTHASSIGLSIPDLGALSCKPPATSCGPG